YRKGQVLHSVFAAALLFCLFSKCHQQEWLTFAKSHVARPLFSIILSSDIFQAYGNYLPSAGLV
ncbi:hypothetical protein, partial [Pseudomonas aeruginosa]